MDDRIHFYSGHANGQDSAMPSTYKNKLEKDCIDAHAGLSLFFEWTIEYLFTLGTQIFAISPKLEFWILALENVPYSRAIGEVMSRGLSYSVTGL